MKRDYYEVLGVDRKADDKTLKSAYRKLARKYHPDQNPGDKDAEQKFKEVGEAYAVLSDPEKRKLYDAYGFDGLNGAGPNPYGSEGGFAGNGGFGSSFHFSGQDAEDLFESVFGDLFGHSAGRGRGGRQTGSSFFRSFGGFGDNGSYGSSYGSSDIFGGGRENLDQQASLDVEFMDAVLGTAKHIRVGNSTLEVRIPAGIEEGQSIRLRGRGASSRDGNKGDLLIKIHIKEDNRYTRQGLDLYTSAEIPFATAVLGGEEFLPTPYGNVRCKIPAGIQSDAKIRLRGKGIRKEGKNPATGDEYVRIRIAVPKAPTEEMKRIVREYARVDEKNREKAKAS